MTVKTIFKTIFTTVMVMVIGALFAEWLNVQTTSFQLTSMSKMAVRQAAVLFSQETYKEMDADEGASARGGTVKWESVVDENGGTYISGEFYKGSSADEIYKNLYTTDYFKSWLKGEDTVVSKIGFQPYKTWDSIRLIKLGVVDNKAIPEVTVDTTDWTEYIDAVVANAYKDNLVTPLNMGVPYLDKDTLNNMFQWNLAQLASDCNKDLIRKDDNGKQRIYYKGYRIYAQDAEITKLEYKVYDILSGDAADFHNATNIDATGQGYIGSSGAFSKGDGLSLLDDKSLHYDSTNQIDGDERSKICVVGIEYKVPVSYDGVTPIKRVFEWIMGTSLRVQGLGTRPNDPAQYWNDETQDLTGGGFRGNTNNNSTVAVTSSLVYYIVR